MLSLDAPVSGGVGGAEAATLTFMAGGSKEAFDKAKPILEAMGKRVVHCGEAGAGQAAKICNNMMLGISMIGVCEAFVLAEKLGLSHQALFDVASTSSGQCWSLTTYCPVPGPVPTRAVQQRLQAGLRLRADAEGPEARPGGRRRRRRHDADGRRRRPALRPAQCLGRRRRGLLRHHPPDPRQGKLSGTALSRHVRHRPLETAMSMAEDPLLELVTVRDWLRYAVSRFNAAGLVYGHGTPTALDEAAYLILHTLHLPIDQLDPWLDARLLEGERARRGRHRSRGALRPASRPPTSRNEAWVGRARVLRRRAGHRATFLHRRAAGRRWLPSGDGSPDPTRVPRPSLDLCTGSGCLAILAALAFRGRDGRRQRHSPDALAVAERNVADYGLEDRITLARSDLFDALPARRYDLILSNPPYVTPRRWRPFRRSTRPSRPCAHAGCRRPRYRAANTGRGGGPPDATGHDHRRDRNGARRSWRRSFRSSPFLWLDTEESEGEVFALTRRPRGMQPR